MQMMIPKLRTSSVTLLFVWCFLIDWCHNNDDKGGDDGGLCAKVLRLYIYIEPHVITNICMSKADVGRGEREQ